MECQRFIDSIYKGAEPSEIYRTFDNATDFPYVIHTEDIPSILFFDAEHTDLVSSSEKKHMKTVLSFAAFGHHKDTLKPRLVTHVYVDSSRDPAFNIDYHPSYLHAHYAYRAMLKKRKSGNIGFPQPSDISGHLTRKRLEQVLLTYFTHVKVWIGFGIRNDQKALENVLGYGYEKKHGIRMIDLQQILYDCFNDEGCAYDVHGRRHPLSLAHAASRFLAVDDVLKLETNAHSACGDAEIILKLFDVMIDRNEVSWLRNVIEKYVFEE